MKFSLTLLAVFLPIIVNAQPNAGDVHVIVSPDGALKYNPSNFSASNGTNVHFMFAHNAAHSVTQSTFESPCTYLAGGNGSSGGFDSGIQSGMQWTITITNDQEPIYFFCKSPKLTCGRGMVGTINAPATGPNSPEGFLAAAMVLGANQTPALDGIGSVIGGVNAVAKSTPTPIKSASPSSASPGASKSSGARRLVARSWVAFLASALSLTIS